MELWTRRLPEGHTVVPVAVDDRLIGLGLTVVDEATRYEVIGFDLGSGEPSLLGPGVEVPGSHEVHQTVPYWTGERMVVPPSGEGGAKPGDGAVTVIE